MSKTENQSTDFISITFFFFLVSRAVDELMWKNTLEAGSPQMTM
jgi:hypothetical protein